MFLDIDPRTARLPRYRGELELTEHSAGSLTSQAYHKRWNRKNELLADAAERASVAAAWLGGRDYPQGRLNDAWTLVATGQFHDDQAGTSTPKAYEYTWNTDVLAMNQFAQVFASATDSIAASLDTSGPGHALVVYNPLQIAREDVVDAMLPPGSARGDPRRRPRWGRGSVAGRGSEGPLPGEGPAGQLVRLSGGIAPGSRRGSEVVARGFDLVAGERPLPHPARRERRHREPVRQVSRKGTAGRADPPRLSDPSPARLARVEHGLGRPAESAARVRRRARCGPRRRGRPGARGDRSESEGGRIDVRARRSASRRATPATGSRSTSRSIGRRALRRSRRFCRWRRRTRRRRTTGRSARSSAATTSRNDTRSPPTSGST